MFENCSVFVRIWSGDQTRYPKESPGKHPYFELRDSSQKTKKSHTCFSEMEATFRVHVLAEMRIQKNIPDPHVSTFIFRVFFFWTTFSNWIARNVVKNVQHPEKATLHHSWSDSKDTYLIHSVWVSKSLTKVVFYFFYRPKSALFYRKERAVFYRPWKATSGGALPSISLSFTGNGSQGWNLKELTEGHQMFSVSKKGLRVASHDVVPWAKMATVL
jgi:hypothetical protein